MPLVSELQVPPDNPYSFRGPGSSVKALPGRLGRLEAAPTIPSRGFSGDWNLCPAIPDPGPWRGRDAGDSTVARRGPDSGICTETYMASGKCPLSASLHMRTACFLRTRKRGCSDRAPSCPTPPSYCSEAGGPMGKLRNRLNKVSPYWGRLQTFLWLAKHPHPQPLLCPCCFLSDRSGHQVNKAVLSWWTRVLTAWSPGKEGRAMAGSGVEKGPGGHWAVEGWGLMSLGGPDGGPA